MRALLKVICLAAVVALSGCGNAFEKITIGKWVEVGRSEAPETPEPADPGRFIIETTQPGNGRAVMPGDLVKARLQVTTSGEQLEPLLRKPQTIWLWVGSEPPADTRTPRSTFAFYGSLGPAAFRKALIGRKLRETFTLRSAPGAENSSYTLPLRALAADFPDVDGVPEFVSIAGNRVPSPTWPHVLLSLHDSVASVEILQVCEAKLFRRTAVLRQAGIWFLWEGGGLPVVRKGELGWSMIDARCPSPEGHFRLQAGPFRTGEYGRASELLAWPHSYVELRPPRMFPEEWFLERMP
jgi:hypothetical protein